MHKKNVCYALYFTAIYRGVYRISFSPGADFILRVGTKNILITGRENFVSALPLKKICLWGIKDKRGTEHLIIIKERFVLASGSLISTMKKI